MNFRYTASFAILVGGLGLSVLAGPALADARQDVLSATQRCAGIADDRTWLDCYYGSAQPMRARLGLPPAPAAQVRMVPQGNIAPPAYIPQPTYMAPPAYGAQPAYSAQAPMQAPPAYGIPVNPQVAAKPPGPPPLKHNSNQGFFTSVFGGGKPVVANVRMSAYGSDKDNVFKVTLADGEIWQLNDSVNVSQPKWKGPASRYVVNIYEGAIGSYNMEVSDDSTVYKVRRIN
jgi:hypothetical protein